MDIINNIFTMLQTVWIFIDNSNDIVKLTLISVGLFLYWKIASPILLKIISLLGFKFFSEPYLQSLFLNKKLMKIGLIVFPFFILNISLPDIGWTFNPQTYIASFQQAHNGNGVGKHISETIVSQYGGLSNGIQANIITQNSDLLIKNAPLIGTGKLISNILYLSNFILFLWWLSTFLSHTVHYFSGQEKYSKKPLHGFSQIIFIICLIIVIATLYAHYTDQSPITLFTTLSVMSVAVFMTLKDIIMGVISTIIIMSSDLVRVGDWIRSDKYGANGHVTEISLTTIKVQNFDKTISNIPTYSFISEGFNNQQEMINSGLRRVKQTIRLEPSTIKYLTDEELNKFKNIEYLTSYIEQRLTSYNKKNNKSDVDYSNPLNGKRLTNLDLYRKYIELYLKEHSLVYSPAPTPVSHNASNDNRNFLSKKYNKNLSDTAPCNLHHRRQ